MKRTKKSLLFSGLALMMSALLLAGTTFAWFTDSVTNKGNTIESGTLDIELNENDETPLFSSTDFMWEPGRSQQKVVTLSNAGSLWLKYTMSFTNVQTTGENLTEVLDVYKVAGDNAKPEDLIPENKLGTMAELMKQGSFETENGVLAPKGSTEGNTSETFTLVIKMQETADNKYQNASVNFAIDVRATQYTKETDGFGNEDYDAGAEFDPVSVSTSEELEKMVADGKPVALENDITLTGALQASGDVTIVGNGHKLNIPAGTDRVINVAETSEPVTITLKDVDMPGPTTGTYTRGISIWEAEEEVTIVMDNCSLGANYYAINSAFGNDKINAVIRNSTISGWAVLNTHSPYANLTFENCTLIGNNDKPYNADGWNGFATFVFDNASGNPDPDGAHDCTLNFKNCRIEANSDTDNAQYFFSIRAINTTINAENCTFVKNGKELTTMDEITSNISVRDYALDSFVFNVK